LNGWGREKERDFSVPGEGNQRSGPKKGRKRTLSGRKKDQGQGKKLKKGLRIQAWGDKRRSRREGKRNGGKEKGKSLWLTRQKPRKSVGVDLRGNSKRLQKKGDR